MLKDEDKRLDLVTRLLETAWTNFDRRRAYEWKFSLALWTALTAFIALTLRGDLPRLSGCAVPWVLIVCGIVVVGLHAFFEENVRRANNVDKARAQTYEDKLNGQECLDIPWDAVKAAVDKLLFKKQGGWSTFVQVGITLILVVAAGLIISGKL